MVRRGHVPQRMCVSCGRRAPRHELVRFCVRDRDGRAVLELDRLGTEHGRGIWLCALEDCLDKALKRDSMRRRLRADANAENLRQDFIDHITDSETTDGKKESIRDS